MKKKKSRSKNSWFIAIRGSYLPVSWQGWLTYIPFVGYLVGSLLVVYKQTHSLGLILFTVPAMWVFAVLVMTYIAKHHS
ncbi:MAG TPA: hypothetical protein VMR34_01710 [Candidatus Saccharimonadales bacterium]|nr:hypothetical protein [Candidatus Saccharimonadales bacterium]